MVHGSERNLDSRIEIWDAGDGSTLASYHPGPRIKRFALLSTETATDIVLNTAANDLVRLAYGDGELHERRHVRSDRELDVIADDIIAQVMHHAPMVAGIGRYPGPPVELAGREPVRIPAGGSARAKAGWAKPNRASTTTVPERGVRTAGSTVPSTRPERSCMASSALRPSS